MDFMYEHLPDGRSIRVLNVIDDSNCEALGIGVDFSLPSGRVIRTLGHGIQPFLHTCDAPPDVTWGL